MRYIVLPVSVRENRFGATRADDDMKLYNGSKYQRIAGLGSTLLNLSNCFTFYDDVIQTLAYRCHFIMGLQCYRLEYSTHAVMDGSAV